MRRYAPFLLIALIVLIGGYWYSHEKTGNSGQTDLPNGSAHSPSATDNTRRPRHAPPRLTPFPETITLLPIAASARALHSPETSPQDDLSLIQSLLRSHRRALGSNPVGLNDEITSALTGKNRKGAASLPNNHPAISKDGELLDRWGTPYRFHAYSGKLLEVSSAGPDKKFFTPDDLSLREP